MVTLGSWMSPTTLSSETVLPEPDSPTMPTTSRAPIRNDTPSTAWTIPCSVWNDTLRSRTSRSASSGWLGTPHPRVEESIGHVDHGIGHDHEEGGVHDRRHDHRQVQAL